MQRRPGESWGRVVSVAELADSGEEVVLVVLLLSNLPGAGLGFSYCSACFGIFSLHIIHVHAFFLLSFPFSSSLYILRYLRSTSRSAMDIEPNFVI